MVGEEEKAVTSREFSAYRRLLEMMTSFKYLGRVISVADDDWPEVIRNLENAWAVWRRMTRILGREEAMPRMSGFLFKTIMKSVLLFGAEMWVVTPRTGRVLGGFQD